MINQNKFKERSVVYLFLVAVYAWFTWVFLFAPITADRYQEQYTIFKLGNITNCISDNLLWMQNQNLRGLSRLFSMLVDCSPILSACSNALMVIGIIILIVQMGDGGGIKKEYIVLTFIGLLLVGKGEISEVYFYAHTLYLSSTILVLIYAQVLLASNKHKSLHLMILLIIGFFWLEIVMIAMCVMQLSYLVINRREAHQKCSIYLVSLLAVALTIVDILYVKQIAAYRFTSTTLAENSNILYTLGTGLYSYLLDHYLMFAVLYLIILFSDSKQHYVYGLLKGIVGFIGLLSTVVFALINVNASLSEWKQEILLNKANEILMYKAGQTFPAIMILVWVTLLYSLLLFEWFSSNKKCESILIVTAAVETILFIMCFTNQPRIGYLSTVLNYTVCILTFIWRGRREKEKRILPIIFLAAFVYLWNVTAFILVNHEISERRNQIVEEVRVLQSIGEWDYSAEVRFPIYKTPIGGLYCPGGEALKVGTMDYNNMLNYYKLDEKTLIEYK